MKKTIKAWAIVKVEVKKVISQVINNPQVSLPPISYRITDCSNEKYTSEYIDVEDFNKYLKRLQKQLIERIELL